MKKQITLKTHIIASATEMRELENTGDLVEVPINDERHRVIDYMRHETMRPYRIEGCTETIRWDGEGAGEVHCTDDRAREIKHHISDQLFGNHNE